MADTKALIDDLKKKNNKTNISFDDRAKGVAVAGVIGAGMGFAVGYFRGYNKFFTTTIGLMAATLIAGIATKK